MSRDAELLYGDVSEDISSRIVFEFFDELYPDNTTWHQVTLEQLIELHKRLCDVLYKEQMDLDLMSTTVDDNTINPVKRAIKAMKENPELVFWYSGG